MPKRYLESEELDKPRAKKKLAVGAGSAPDDASPYLFEQVDTPLLYLKEQVSSLDLASPLPTSLPFHVTGSDDLQQPETEPSPCLRKSIITEEIKSTIEGLAITRKSTPPFETWGYPEKNSVYGGNPFDDLLRGRKKRDNVNDLSELKDTGYERVDERFVCASKYPDLVTIFMYRGDPKQAIDAPGMPPFIRIHETKLRSTSNIFSNIIEEKRFGGKIGDYVVYDADTAARFNPEIQELGIYVDGLMNTRLARRMKNYNRVASLTIVQIWIGIEVWGFWMWNGTFPRRLNEEMLVNAMLVGMFLGDADYQEQLFEMILHRRYGENYPRVRAIQRGCAKSFGVTVHEHCGCIC